MMKIILTTDLKGKGKRRIIDIPAGHATSFTEQPSTSGDCGKHHSWKIEWRRKQLRNACGTKCWVKRIHRKSDQIAVRVGKEGNF